MKKSIILLVAIMSLFLVPQYTLAQTPDTDRVKESVAAALRLQEAEMLMVSNNDSTRKSCPCSEYCECGCNHGLGCDCKVTRTFTPPQVYYYPQPNYSTLYIAPTAGVSTGRFAQPDFYQYRQIGGGGGRRGSFRSGGGGG